MVTFHKLQENFTHATKTLTWEGGGGGGGGGGGFVKSKVLVPLHGHKKELNVLWKKINTW